MHTRAGIDESGLTGYDNTAAGAAHGGKPMAKQWQNDEAFTRWLVLSRYARQEGGKVVPYLTGGVVLYMWEAWSAGQALGVTDASN
jgi:hypothetical protein